jgi:hypothetical protein
MSKQANNWFLSFSRQIRPIIIDSVTDKFVRAKKELMIGIALHPISIDINSHSTSQKLGSTSGTLFGFLGFENGDDPIKELIELVDDLIDIEVLPPTSSKGLAKVIVTIPTKDSLNDLKPLEWTDTPWPILIEQGISGLQNYINKNKGDGRSQEGVQSTNTIRSADFIAEDYLTGLFSQFRKNLAVGRIK